MKEEDKDIWIKCVDCGTEFCFRVEEQKFYKENGLLPPKRCRPCRPAKRIRFANGGDKNA